jgi:hypothetical protein
VRRIDRIREELAEDLGVTISRAQAFRMLLDTALPKTERKLGLPPPDEAS